MQTANQYMIALTADERTPNVKAMVDIILLDAAKAIDEQINAAWREGYDEGYHDGHDAGFDEGYERGLAEAEESEE